MTCRARHATAGQRNVLPQARAGSAATPTRSSHPSSERALHTPTACRHGTPRRHTPRHHTPRRRTQRRRTLRRRTPTRHRTPAVATRIHRNASPPFPPTPCAIGPMRYRPHGRSAPMGDRSVRPSSHIGRWEPPSGGWASRDDAELREQGLNLLGERPYRLDAHDGVGLGDGLGDGQRILEGELLLDARHLLGHRHFEHSRRHGPGGRRARHGALAAPLGLRLRRRWPLHEGAGGGALEGHELVIEGVQVGLPQRLGLIHR
mmetsp:Transcript_68165/g.186825  ORF Transcript_68165/g.186825 Transcript_68165/m.186825 type:complete len:261 (-) Transcript_68165:1077-1859(-)